MGNLGLSMWVFEGLGSGIRGVEGKEKLKRKIFRFLEFVFIGMCFL